MINEKTRNIGAVFIHVERLISVTRQRYTMLQSTLSITLMQTDKITELTIVDKVVCVANGRRILHEVQGFPERGCM